MEFRKVGDELHLIDENNIPLLKFGEGYIKRYCFKSHYNSYKFNGKNLPNPDNVSRGDIFAAMNEFYGEDKGEYITTLVVEGRNSLWKKVEHYSSIFRFPKDRIFTTYTSDYLDADSENLEIVEEEIPVYTDSNDSLNFKKIPLIYSNYRLDLGDIEGEPVLSNNTTNIYINTNGDGVKFKFKSFPINNVFEIGDKEEIINVFSVNKGWLISKINQSILKEQFKTLVGGSKSLMRAEKYVYIPRDKIITRWSKYLNLSWTIRKLLISNKKPNSYKFLRTFLRCNSDERSIISQLGEDYINKLIIYKNDSIVNGIDSKVNIKIIREIIDHYYNTTYDVFYYYREYLRLKKKLRKKTPSFPSSEDLTKYVNDFREEERIVDNQTIFPNIKDELRYEGENFIVTLPLCGADLILEGKALHHCVGGYINNVKSGYSNIVFIRKKEDPYTSFYTVELDQNYNLRQIHGLQNIDPTKEVEEFLNEYLCRLKHKE